MAMRVCVGPSPGVRCPTAELTPKGTSRCGACAGIAEKRRGTASQRGYGTAHQRLRAWWQRKLDKGETILCWRCGTTINPTSWHLGHDDHDRTKYRGPECVPCNTATSGR